MCSERLVTPNFRRKFADHNGGGTQKDRNRLILPRVRNTELPKAYSFTDISNQCRSRSVAKVSFDSLITVRSYTTVLGENPAVSDGPPVSIGWDYISEKLSLEMFDDHSNHVRHPNEYHLDSPTRLKRLQNNGVSKQEIEDAIIEIDCVKRFRRMNSIRSTMMGVIRSPLIDTNEVVATENINEKISPVTATKKIPRAKQGGSLTWAITPQRSRFSLESKRKKLLASSVWHYQCQTKTPFPKSRSVSLPLA